MSNQPRTFEDTAAARSEVPLLTGIMGPSGGGKTYSALRIATGIQQITGGDIGVIDTESRRALHYAESFKFRHVDFKAPFGPLDYLAAIQHFEHKGCKVIIVDSMSHEHEGPGGVLEMHDAIMGGDFKKSMQAWIKPKADRRRMINSILQMPIHFIFCFRAKEKMKPFQGGQPKELGFMPIAGEEFIFEMTVNALLMPNAGGVPTWMSQQPGEQMMMKLPQQFRQMLSVQKPLDEETGKLMAEWAKGGAIAHKTAKPKSAALPDDGEPASVELIADLVAAFEDRQWTDDRKNELLMRVSDLRVKKKLEPAARWNQLTKGQIRWAINQVK